jgi:hypothetical protein
MIGNKIKAGNIYLEGYMPKMIKEISDKFEKAIGKKTKVYVVPGAPGKTLVKSEVYWPHGRTRHTQINCWQDYVLCTQDSARDMQCSERVSRTSIQSRTRTLESIRMMCQLPDRY